MKPIKNIFVIILTFVVSLALLYFMWEKEWKPLATMTELGYQELTPVAKATKPITLSDGHESTQYYVVVAVDTVDGLKQLYIEIEEAYDEDDLLKSLNYYSSKKKVGGYYFYSDINKAVYFSKDIATAQEYMENSAKKVVWVVIIVNAALIIITLLVTILGSTKLPLIPGGDWTNDQLIVCRYGNYAYGVIAVMCVSFGVGMIYLAYYLLTSAESSDSIMAGIMFGPLALVFIALGVILMMFMKNYVMVFYPKGVVYRNAIGRTWFFTDEDVQYVSVIHMYRNHSFRIQTKEKNIYLNFYCTNYFQAERYVEEKYTDMKPYLENNKH